MRNVKDITKIYLFTKELLKLSNYQKKNYVLVKKRSLKPFLNFDNESAHIRESGNKFHLSIYLCQKENFKILVLEKRFQIFLLFLDLNV